MQIELRRAYHPLLELILIFSPVRTLQAGLVDTKPPGKDVTGLVQTIEEGGRPHMLWLVVIWVQKCNNPLGQHSFQVTLNEY